MPKALHWVDEDYQLRKDLEVEAVPQELFYAPEELEVLGDEREALAVAAAARRLVRAVHEEGDWQARLRLLRPLEQEHARSRGLLLIIILTAQVPTD